MDKVRVNNEDQLRLDQLFELQESVYEQIMREILLDIVEGYKSQDNEVHRLVKKYLNGELSRSEKREVEKKVFKVGNCYKKDSGQAFLVKSHHKDYYRDKLSKKLKNRNEQTI
jgi:hypothetical protein